MEQYQLPEKYHSNVKVVRHKRNKANYEDNKFVPPIAMPWIRKISYLPGSTLHVGIAIQFLKAVNGSNTFSLSYKLLLEDFNVHKDSVRRAIKELEKAGVISVVGHPGRSPVITVL